MSKSNSTVPPELASILATLAQFAQPQPDQQQQPTAPEVSHLNPTDPRLQGRQQRSATHTPQPSSHPQNHAYDKPYQSTSTNITQLPGIQNIQPQVQQEQPSFNSYNPQATAFQPSKPQGKSTPQVQDQTIIDPATITEWSAGLRCVTKIAAQNPMFADKIRSMINDQRRNEMQWYSSRQALKQMQAKRAAGANEIQNILAGITPNSTLPTQQAIQTPAEKQSELEAFDRKLYKAQLAMNDSMSNILKSLGVPFFGTHSYLILPDGQVAGGLVDTKSEAIQGENRPKWSPRVSGEELVGLRRRMVAYLEDMYKA